MCHVNIFRYKTHTELEKNSFPFIHLDNIYISFYFFFIIFFTASAFQAGGRAGFIPSRVCIRHTYRYSPFRKTKFNAYKKLASKYCKRQYSLKNLVKFSLKKNKNK